MALKAAVAPGGNVISSVCICNQEYIGALRVALKLNDPTLVANVFSACEVLP